MGEVETSSKAGRLLAVFLTFAALGCANETGLDATDSEQNVELLGELLLYVVDYPDQTSEMRYELETDAGEVWELVFDAEPALAPRDRLRVIGKDLGEQRFAVHTFETLDRDERGIAVTEQAIGTNVMSSRLAVLLVHWSAPDQLSVDSMRQKVFTGPTSTAAFYRENSYGLFELTGDVFGWYQIPSPGGCNSRSIASSARQAAAAAGVDIGSYDQVLYYFPRTSSCGFSGLASVGSPMNPARDTWYNGSSGCVVLAQELLHNFGALHSRSYGCGASVIAAPGQCSDSEYGDPYDPMGGGCYHTNIYQKAAQGWLGGCNGVTATADGTFFLAPTQLPSDGIQALRIPMSAALCPGGLTSCYYYVEYRQPVGLFDTRDANAQIYQGVLLHVAPGVDFSGSSQPRSPYLLDLTPSSARSDFVDPALVLGATFEDPTGIRITLDEISSTAATVSVQFPGGGSGTPSCIDGSAAPNTPPEPPDPGKCMVGEREFEDHCYVLISTPSSFADAETTCRGRGADWAMVEIESAGENQFVAGLIGSGESWLGGSDGTTEGTWGWRTGTQFWSGGATGGAAAGNYANFVTGEPNDGSATAMGDSDCVRMIAAGGWRDVNCTASYRPVCEQMDPGTVPPLCQTTTDCMQGEVCNDGACTAAPAPMCTADAQCPAGQRCNSGTCVPAPMPPACTADAQCPAGQRCNSGACAPIPPCTTDAQCAIGQTCQAGVCASPVVPGACQTNAQCMAGQLCLAGKCVAGPTPVPMPAETMPPATPSPGTAGTGAPPFGSPPLTPGPGPSSRGGASSGCNVHAGNPPARGAWPYAAFAALGLSALRIRSSTRHWRDRARGLHCEQR